MPPLGGDIDNWPCVPLALQSGFWSLNEKKLPTLKQLTKKYQLKVAIKLIQFFSLLWTNINKGRKIERTKERKNERKKERTKERKNKERKKARKERKKIANPF